MSSKKCDGKKLHDDDWAFVDKEGTLLPKEKIKTSKSKTKNQERKKRARPKKEEVEADFEVIKDGGLTTSTIIATTELPPFLKETSDVEEDWGIVKKPPASSPRPDLAPTQSADTRVEPKPNLEDVEFIQIPEAHHGVESLSDTSSTCSFDVIDDNKKKILLDTEMEKNSVDNDADDSCGDDMEIQGAEFRFDFPTVVALFCLTTVLGFVIGHGVGIATSLLVVKTPMLKTPPEMTPDTATKPQSDENIEQNQDSQLEGKIQKWKSLYRGQKELQEENQNTGVKISGNLPGLKEAHKQLSLENYKLKKAYNDIEKQLDLMKVMSWYRRAQVDKLRQNDKWNMTYVVGILRKELQYLEAVYLREKRLADMWRHEEKEKGESSPDTWKEFKERWNKIYRDSDGHERVCVGRQDCEGETSVPEDTSGSNKKTLDETLDTQITESNTELGNIETEESSEAKGDFGTVEDTKSSNEGIQQRQKRETQENFMHLGNLREDHPAENLFWRHLRLAKTEQDENMEDHKENQNDQNKLSTEETATGDNTMQTNDQNGSSERLLDNEDSSENDKPNDTDNKEPDTTDDSGNTSGGFLTQQQPDWFSYEVLEDEDIIIAFENKDNVDHVLYGFLDGEFRQIDMNPGNVLVMSMKTECFDVNSNFVVSVINNYQKPVHFVALLPNGEIKHQKIAEQVRVTIVEMGSKETGERKPLIHEATVLENGKLEIREQNDGEFDVGEENGESGEENDKNKVENNAHENMESEERQDEVNETPKPNQEVPLSSLTPGESHFFNQCTRNIYRQTVSAHQYPISEYETLLAHIRQKQEKVYYRFQQNMIVEKFIVKDEVVKMNNDGSITIGGDDEEPVEDTTENRKPVQYEEEVSTIVGQLLKNTWEEGKRVAVMMTYDSDTGTVTTIDVTLFNVHPDDVISHDVLKNGKMEKIDDTTKFTSYLLHENKLLRIVREDHLKRGFTKIKPKEETDGDLVDDNTGNENCSSSETKDEKYSSNSENEGENFSNSEDEDENFSNSENEDDEYSSSENKDELEPNSDDLFEEDSSQTLEDDGAESQNEECTLDLDEEGLNEYWAYTIDRGAIFIQETIERVIPTPKYKQEDFGKLNMTTNDVEESVSYVYCKDGSVQKTWRRIEKVPRNKARDESVEDKRDVVDDGEELQEDWTEKEDVYENQYDGDEDYDNRDDLNDTDRDYEHDGIGDDVGGNNDDLESEHHDDDDDDIYEDDIDEDDIDEDDIDEDDIDEDDYDESDYNGFDHEYDDDYIDDMDDDIDDIDDIDDDINHDNDDDNDEKGTPEHFPQDHKQESHRPQPKPDQEKINKKPNSTHVDKNSDDSESIRNEEQRKDLEKANYELFISREWQNLKLRQQQFEHSKKKHLRGIQQQMQEEWSKMKQQYREFQENFQKSDLDIEGKKFYNLKKKIEDELKKSLKDEWDKLKKKQEEIETREKVLVEENESVVGYEDVVRYHFNLGRQRTIVDQGKDIDEHLGTERGLNNADKNRNEQREVTSREKNENSDDKANGEVLNDFKKMEETERESYYQDISSETPESTDELVIAPWLIKSIHSNPNQDNYDSYVDSMENEAWEMSDSGVDTPTMDDNLLHELPYIGKTDENLSEDYHVDKMLSEAWEMSDITSDEEQETMHYNPPQEIPHIPSTYASEYVEQLTNTQFTNAYEPRDITFQIDASEDPPLKENEEIPYKDSTTDNIQLNEPSLDPSDNGSPNFEAEDTPSSPQWELQIQKLREEIDKLYKARTAQRNGNELQVVKQDIDLPIKPVVESIPKPKNVVQLKCPPKCPKTPSDSTKDVTTMHNINPSTPHKPEEKSKLQSFPKKPDQKIHQQLFPKKSYQKPKEPSFPKEFHDKTKQPSLPKKLDKKTKHPSEIETEDNEKKRKSYALMDFIEGHSYLRQLEPEEYDEKMPAFKIGPLAPGKKAKKNKLKLKEKSKDKSKSTERAAKKKRKEKKLKKAEENGLERLSKRRQKEERKISNNLPLIPPNEKKNTKKNKKPKGGKYTRKTQ